MTEVVQERKWEDLGDGFEFSDQTDPSLVRSILGLDGGEPAKLVEEERRRLANWLLRGDHLSKQDLVKLRTMRRTIEPTGVAREVGSSYPDPVPGNSNKHLQRR